MPELIYTDTPRGKFEVADVKAEGGGVLRVGLEYDTIGRPRAFHMAMGVGEGDQWRETPGAGSGFAIPPDRIGDLIRTLLIFLDRTW
jgi:hypothetical protein